MAKILLTGGAGFIGTALIEKLINENEIFVLDNLDRNSLKNKNFEVTLFETDIINYHEVYKNLVEACPDIVIHLAAIAGVDNVIKRSVSVMDVNMIGTNNLLKAMVSSNCIKNVKKFINFSTSEVYGSYSYKLCEDEHTTLGSVGEARWMYAVSKLASEHLCFAYYNQFGLPLVSVRPFNIYGPNQVGEGAIHIFIKKCIKNEDIEVHDDGSQIRSWCYIDDAVDFVLKCIYNENIIGHVLNLGNPEGTISIINLARKVIELTKSKSKVKFIKSPYVDVELRIPNINKAKQILNYKPKVGLDEGILKTFGWYKEMI